ncbi:hypothetical protein H5410_002485 [Solanum commersonii]|uniref:Uncharacterized protein n=1 Tax=Solanum commersonii TaxID=4109 RepID=A0A9J6B280_SOLCO|nr:hypothetical protein H5410_002485 [Solanum commersonii]
MLRIDQRRGMEQNKEGNEKQVNSKAVIPKEIRNLAFDRKFKEGELRTRGRISHEGWGLNGESKRALVETKITRNESNLYQQIWNNRWLGEAQVEAIGRSGGIVVLWDKRVWKGKMVDSGNQMLTCRFEGIEQELTWHLSAIYADCDREGRRELWWELAAIRSLFEGPWVVCGDFNITRYPEERTNCQRINGQ